ncbi:hypothetical protein K491DRAFT_684565 [Lophiostoma macrostomum CBS 122681]|uniref:Uncharacterized protein n=1 Tax=Lophiostoma macrostomum CBS 122681 TaxID=1314788 RepID=A0A6A6SQF2_9PLEO|nr:hypothetical protein K491DRAFT_684565 [Lophiostoma macrostomum CBS 122681]
MRIPLFILYWSILLITLFLIIPSVSADIFEYHITTLTYPQALQPEPQVSHANSTLPSSPGPAEDMQTVLTSAANFIIARVASLKLGRALTEAEMALSMQFWTKELGLSEREMQDIGQMVEVLVGGWNGRRGEEGGWRDGKSGAEEFDERWERFVKDFGVKGTQA